MQLKRLLSLFIALGICLFFLWIVMGSETFQSCIFDPKYYQSNDNSQDGFSVFTTLLMTYRHCVGVYVNS